MKSWHLDLVIEDATWEKASAMFVDIIKLIEEKGLIAGGGLHSFGDVTVDEECENCPKTTLRLPKGKYHVAESIELPHELIIAGS